MNSLSLILKGPKLTSKNCDNTMHQRVINPKIIKTTEFHGEKTEWTQ